MLQRRKVMVMSRVQSVGDDDEVPVNKGGRPSGTEFDPWVPEHHAEYKPERLYTRSTNKHDHSVKNDVRMPPGIHAMVSEVVDKVPGYRSMADFYRDAVVHRMRWWLERDMELTPILKYRLDMELWLADLDQLQQIMELGENLTSTNRELLERAATSRNVWVLGKTIQGVEDRAEELGQPYEGQLRELAKEYRKRMKEMGDG